MRTPPLKSGATPGITPALSEAKLRTPAKVTEVPMGPCGPAKRTPSRRLPGLLVGLAKPVVAAALMATLFSGPAVAQGAALDTLAPQAQSQSQTPKVRAPLAQAYERLIARDVGKGGSIDGAGWGNELEGIDSLARAVYDFADLNNPNGNYGFWGGQLRGVYSEGGLGVGYTMRPKVRGALNFVTVKDLQTGVRDLDRQLDAPRPKDQGTADIDTLRARGLSFSDVHSLAERLLDTIVDIEEAKERATNQGVALLTHAELLDALEPGSDLHALAQTVFDSQGWSQVLGREIKQIDANRKAFARGPMKDATHVDEGVTHYLLLLGKRAQQDSLLDQVRSHL